MNLYWFMGFLEGEGNFSIKTQKDGTHFILSQHEESTKTMEGIYKLISNWEPDSNCPIKNNIKKIPNTIYPDKNKVRVIVTAVDYLYWVFIPNLLKYPFQTRKAIDFIQWVIVVYMKKHGLHRTREGRDLINIIKLNQNKLRYGINRIIDKSLIYDILKRKSLYNVINTHDSNYRRRDYNI